MFGILFKFMTLDMSINIYFHVYFIDYSEYLKVHHKKFHSLSKFNLSRVLIIKVNNRVSFSNCLNQLLTKTCFIYARYAEGKHFINLNIQNSI